MDKFRMRDDHPSVSRRAPELDHRIFPSLPAADLPEVASEPTDSFENTACDLVGMLSQRQVH